MRSLLKYLVIFSSILSSCHCIFKLINVFQGSIASFPCTKVLLDFAADDRCLFIPHAGAMVSTYRGTSDHCYITVTTCTLLVNYYYYELLLLLLVSCYELLLLLSILLFYYYITITLLFVL